MSNKSDDITTGEVNTLLLKAALRVAAKKLVTGSVVQNMSEAGADMATDAPVTINGDSTKDLRQSSWLRLAESARARLNNKNKKEDSESVATLFKNAYLKSKE